MIEAFINRSERKVKAAGNAIEMAVETCHIAEAIFCNLKEHDVKTAAVYLASVVKGMEFVCNRAVEEKNEDRTRDNSDKAQGEEEDKVFERRRT